MNVISKSMRWIAQRSGYSLVRCQRRNGFPVDFAAGEVDVIRSVRPYTKTSPERLHALIYASEYIVRNAIPGAIVECGVWKGGSMMTVARSLLELEAGDRDLYLFDTFEGMVRPTVHDVSHNGVKASTKFEKRRIHDHSSDWCFAPLEAVSKLMLDTGYDADRLHFVKGMVEETLPERAPDAISLLRLDTDWYESTRHELVHLFPRVSTGGVIIIDDYGDWLGARKAVDEYLAEHNIKLLLSRIDSSGRIGVKL